MTSRWPFSLKYSGSPRCCSARRPPSRAARMATPSRGLSSSMLTSISSIAWVLNLRARPGRVTKLVQAVADASGQHQARVIAHADVAAVGRDTDDAVQLLQAIDGLLQLVAAGNGCDQLELELNRGQER